MPIGLAQSWSAQSVEVGVVRTLLLFCCCILLVEVAFGLTLGCFVQSDMVVALPLYRFLPLFGESPQRRKKKNVEFRVFS